MKNIDLAFAYFEHVMGRPLNDVQPRPLSGSEVAHILWGMNEIFSPRLERIRTVKYESRFESDADIAIELFVEEPVPNTWESLSAGTWRVLLERHQQFMQVALANDLVGHIVTHIPAGLPDSELLPGLMLLLLHSMKLPFQVEDRSLLELSSGGPPVSLRPH